MAFSIPSISIIIFCFLLTSSTGVFAKNLHQNPIRMADSSGFSVTNDPNPRPPEDAVHQTTNPDGSTTKTMFDGSDVTSYSNGTHITKYQDGSSRTQNADGSQILKDANQNVVQNYPDGTQIIQKQNGPTVKTDSMGTKSTLEPNGTLIQENLKKKQKIIKKPDGTTQTTGF